MSWKESEAVPKGNDPVAQQEEFGFSQPTLVDIYRMAKEIFPRSVGQKNGEVCGEFEKYEPACSKARAGRSAATSHQ